MTETTSPSRSRGRPRNDGSVQTGDFRENAIYATLVRGYRKTDLVVGGKLDVAALIRRLEVSRQTVYRILNKHPITEKVALRLIEVSKDADGNPGLTVQALRPHLKDTVQALIPTT